MAEQRIGRQLPTQSVILPYEQTHGKEAVDIYNTTGRKAQEWQEIMIYDILAYNGENLWVHTKFGYSVPRRNGKNEVVAMREMWGVKHGEKILHTAHRTTTSHTAWERLCSLLDKAKITYKSIKATGRECIYIKGSDARVEFRTRSSKGGLGEGFDLLIIDEAQEYTDDQESALKYVVSDAKNPQTLFCGTPPTNVSSGTVFTKQRDKVLAGGAINVLICTLLSPLSCSLLLSQHHLFCILIEPSAKSYHPFLPFSLAVKRKVEDISSTFCISIIQVNILFTFSSTYSTASSKKPSS